MTPDDLLDYAERLNKAAWQLNDLAHETMDDRERKRLLAKAEGIMVAISYLRDYKSDALVAPCYALFPDDSSVLVLRIDGDQARVMNEDGAYWDEPVSNLRRTTGTW